MAKLNSVFTFTGRVGQTVGMKGEKGQTYLRQHVKPANNSTKGQVDQRVKFALGGLLSKMTDSDLLVGMASSRRERRRMFVANIVRNATVVDTTSGAQAKLDPDKLVFSNGNFVAIPTVTASFDGNEVTAAVAAALPEGYAGLLVIAATYDTQKGMYTSISGEIIPATGGSIQIPTAGGTSANIYVVPIVRSATATNVSYEHAVEEISGHGYGAAATAANSGVLEYAQSVFESSVSSSD